MVGATGTALGQACFELVDKHRCVLCGWGVIVPSILVSIRGDVRRAVGEGDEVFEWMCVLLVVPFYKRPNAFLNSLRLLGIACGI